MAFSETGHFTCPRRSEVFQDRTPNQDRWQRMTGARDLHSCSYCGSLAPDEFMQAVRDGCEIGPTDKSYKAYVEGLGTFAKFYYQHLSVEQRIEFIDLYNDRTMNIGYPGHFYQLPFFMGYVESAD